MVIDFWKITVRAGANSLAASCNILAGTSSGALGRSDPDAFGRVGSNGLKRRNDDIS